MDWDLTRDVVGEPTVDSLRDDPDEDLTLGWSLLRALAEADEQATEIAPGVYCFSKSSAERMI